MRKWARNLKAVQRQKTGTEEEGEEIVGRGGKNNINLAIVAANNHIAGFGPGTANLFRSDSSIAGPKNILFVKFLIKGTIYY
jgi:hypothetical protein